MAKLSDTQVYGSLIIDGALIAGAGAGFSNMVALTTSGTYTFPVALQVPGAKFKVTIVGAGGQGGGCTTTSGYCGAGGASGAVCIAYITVVSGLYSFTYTIGVRGSTSGTNAVGQTGTSSTVVYNSVTYTAGGGGGGGIASTTETRPNGGTATNGTFNLTGSYGLSCGVRNTVSCYIGRGGDTPLGFGQGGNSGSPGGTGKTASGYGAGGGGGAFYSTATARAGGPGTGGIIIVEY
jgi:hypothetical protein